MLAFFRPAKYLLLVLCLAVLGNNSSLAQVTSVTDDQSTPIPGTPHDYIKMLNETVNPADGSLSIRIQLPVPMGRLLTVPFAVTYDSNGVHTPYNGYGGGDWSSDLSFISQGGWSYSIPQMSYQIGASGSGTTECHYNDAFVFTEASGARHSLNKLSTSATGNGLTPCAPGSLASGDDFVQAALTAGNGGAAVSSVLVADADGTVYQFPSTAFHNDPAPNGSTLRGFAASIEDRNGNEVTVTDQGSGAFTVTDSTGRASITSSGFGATGNTITVSGLSNPYAMTWGSATSTFSPNASWVGGAQDTHCTGFGGVSNASQNEITQISVPGEGTYTFTYDTGNSGLLTEIEYPSGGWVKYTWGYSATQNEFAAFADSNGVSDACTYLYNTFVITSRTVSFDGVHTALQQSFSYTTTWSGTSWTAKTTTVTTQDVLASGQPTYTATYTYNGQYRAPIPPDAICYYATQIPVEQSVVYNDSNGSVLETDTEGWLDQYELGCKAVTLGSSTRAVFYTYGSGAQITDKKEYDYGQLSASQCSNGATAPTSPTPLRETATSYYYPAATRIYPSAPSIFDRPSSVITYGSGSKAAETDYTYDGSNLVSASGFPGHDDTNYGTSYNNRGNATGKSEWLNTGSPLPWSYTYDETGQRMSMAEPNNATTSYTYENENAYLAQITYPATNGVAHTVSFTYNFPSGELATSTDENNQVTKYWYNDPLLRLTEVQYPDGGETNYGYTSICASPSSTSIFIKGSTSYTETAALDGVCHLTTETVTSDPEGDDYTATTYNGRGLVMTASNPYRSTSELSYGVTTYSYDGLGRSTSVQGPDGSTTTTSYSNNCSTITDPAPTKRTLCYDGVGRLTSATEDPSGLDYPTSYTYDALNNLATVAQGSQTRTFVHDSVSRLTSATNPESGTTSYTYDTDSVCGVTFEGDMVKRVDARSIRTCYSYDALHRVLQKTYFDGTPTANFFYDETTVTLGSWTSPALNYPNGRLTHTTTVNSAGTTLAGTVQDYDQMGRTQDYWQCSPYNCGTSSIWHGYYHYNLAGDNDWWTHPAGYTITNTIDNGRHVTQIQSSLVDSTHPQYLAQNITYTAWGAVSTFVNGYAGSSGSEVEETYQYNNRLQPTIIKLGTTGSPAQYSCLVYNYYSGVSNPSSCTTPTQGTTNNGNVWGLFDDDLTVTSNCHTAAYSYDGVNRLTGAVGTPCASGDESYNFPYIYTADGSNGRYGNMSCVYNGQIAGCSNFSFSATTNQITSSGYTYDAAGNLTEDSSNPTPHTYQWDAEGRVSSVDGGNTWSLTYNALGQRVQWAYPGGADQHLFDPEGTWLGNAGEYTVFWFEGRFMAAYEGSETYFSHDNSIGSTSIMTNHAGNTVEDVLFTPWGDVLTATGTGGYSFAKMDYYDTNTNTSLTPARVLGPNFGRWFTPDPIGVKAVRLDDPQTWNMYAYARNNPTSLVDPTGELATVSTSCSTGSDNQTTCNVNISASIAIYATPASGLTQDQLNAAAATIQNSIQNAWTGSFTDNGVTYNVSTQVSVQVEGSEEAAKNSGAQNVIGLSNGDADPGRHMDSYVNPRQGPFGPDTGVWNINSLGGGVGAHEFTHLLGVGDKLAPVLSNTYGLTYPSLWRHATADDLRWGISEAVDSVNSMKAWTVFPVDPVLLGNTIPVQAPWLLGWK